MQPDTRRRHGNFSIDSLIDGMIEFTSFSNILKPRFALGILTQRYGFNALWPTAGPARIGDLTM